MNWEEWRKHINDVVSSRGQWVGLADGDGVPIIEFPPHESLSAPEARLAPSELQLRVGVRGGAAPVHAVVDELVADNLGATDSEGRLVIVPDVPRLVVVEREGGRQGFFITHVVAEGESEAPSILTVNGVDMLDYLWAHPCPSTPVTWKDNWQTITEDAAQEWAKPRELTAMEMATRADGYTVRGPADQVLRDLIQDSFDAVNTQNGWADDPHLIVDVSGGVSAPEVLIRTSDESIGDTIAQPALQAGVSVSVYLWWPGDAPIETRTGLKTFTHPVGVVRVEHEGGQ